LHYDVKANKRKVKNFPHDLFASVTKFLESTHFFSCFPCQRLPYGQIKRDRPSQRNLCHIEIQRGTIRTNCIDSLDRTNFGQEIIGYRVCLMQLKKLGLTDREDI